jgi:alcohol dehydrogenase class IV
MTNDTLVNDALVLLKEWKGGRYISGCNALDKIPQLLGNAQSIHIVAGKNVRKCGLLDKLLFVINSSNKKVTAVSEGAGPNSPDRDVLQVALDIKKSKPDLVISFGGGSVVDAVKGAIVSASLGGTLEDYFGTGLVTQKINKSQKKLIPHLAIMTASASASHLTKYANITILQTMQKKLIIDDAIIPDSAVYDYHISETMSPDFTNTGAFDGIGHLSEVYYGYPENGPHFKLISKLAAIGIPLICRGLLKLLHNRNDLSARIDLGLGTDLGGYAIMLGSTNGPHLNSFSLVDLMDHGKAVALLQPYYGCYFARAIPDRIRSLCKIYESLGLTDLDQSLDSVDDTHLGNFYASTLINLMKQVAFPSCFNEFSGFNQNYIEKMLSAAKNPQLESKLKAMPVVFTIDHVDSEMRKILQSAMNGDLSLLKH